MADHETLSLASSLTDSLHAEATHQAPQSIHEKVIPRDKKKEQNSHVPPSGYPSRPSSLRSHISNTSVHSIRSSNRVPQSEKRGILSAVTLIPEYRNPRNYSHLQKFTVISIVAFAALAGPMGASIMLPAVDSITSNLNTTVAKVNISVGIYLLSLGIFPMWWSNFSENYGRRSVYVLSFTWYFAFSVGCAVAPNIESLIVLRLLAGVGASAVQACGAGTISDLYIQEERGTALGLFFMGPLLGPFLSPIIGGTVAEGWGWRATMWVMVIVCGLNLVSIIFLLPETLPIDNVDLMPIKADEVLKKDEEMGVGIDMDRVPTISETSSRRQTQNDETPVDLLVPTISRVSTNQSAYSRRVLETQDRGEFGRRNEDNTAHPKPWRSQLYDYTIRPAHAVVFLGYPPILLAIIYSSIGYMGVFFLNISISNRYAEPPYNFSPVITGLMYIPNGITFILASVYGGKWNDWLIRKYAKSHNGELQPEARLSWNMVLAAVLYVPASLIFAWCIQEKQHWVTPLIGSALFGVSTMLVMGTIVIYLVDSLPGKGATGVALNNLIRQILAAVATFVTEPIVSKIGTGVLFSIYAGVVTVAVSALWVLKKRGPQMRERYDITKYYAML